MKFAIKGVDPKLARRQKRQNMLKKPAGFGFFSSATGPKKKLNSLKKKVDPIAANKQRLKEERAAMNRNILQMQAKEKKKQEKLKKVHDKAVNEIPDIFDYDAYKKKVPMRRTGMNFREYGYQDMRKGQAPEEKRESKYVAQILKVAAEKQKEQDIIWERRKLKELKKEEGDYGDVEKFVTSGYEQKLREDKKWTEEDARRARLEDDVTKHEDVTGSFYRNLFNGGFAGSSSEKSSKRKPETRKRMPDRKKTRVEASTAQQSRKRQQEEDRRQQDDAMALNQQLVQNPSSPDPLQDVASAADEDPLQDVAGAADEDPLQDMASAADEDPLQRTPDADDPADSQQELPDTAAPPSPDHTDVPLPLPSEKPVNPNDMMATALDAYLRDQQMRKQEAAEGIVRKASKPKPKPVKAKIDIAALKARYLKRKGKN